MRDNIVLSLENWQKQQQKKPLVKNKRHSTFFYLFRNKNTYIYHNKITFFLSFLFVSPQLFIVKHSVKTLAKINWIIPYYSGPYRTAQWKQGLGVFCPKINNKCCYHEKTGEKSKLVPLRLVYYENHKQPTLFFYVLFHDTDITKKQLFCDTVMVDGLSPYNKIFPLLIRTSNISLLEKKRFRDNALYCRFITRKLAKKQGSPFVASVVQKPQTAYLAFLFIS